MITPEQRLYRLQLTLDKLRTLDARSFRGLARFFEETSGSLIGWQVTTPELQAQGMLLFHGVPKYQEAEGLEAVLLYYGLNKRVAIALFDRLGAGAFYGETPPSWWSRAYALHTKLATDFDYHNSLEGTIDRLQHFIAWLRVHTEKDLLDQ